MRLLSRSNDRTFSSTHADRPTSRRRSRRRRLSLAASAVALVAGLSGAGLGLLVQTSDENREPVPLEVGGVYTVPDRVPFVSDLVVYGTPPEGERPELDELGCQVTGGSLSVDDARREDRLVVDGRGIVPLVSFSGETGQSMGCNGPAAQASAPLYVVPGSNGRRLVPLAGYSVAAIGVPIGVLGLLGLRASRD